jgi:hypothetical protein
MPQLTNLVGQKIRACIVAINGGTVSEYTLHGIEDSGLWIGGLPISEYFALKLGETAVAIAPVVFVPFHQVNVIIDARAALSEPTL